MIGIFSQDNNHYEQLRALRDAADTAPVFQDLSAVLEEREVHTVGVAAVSRDHSFAASAATHSVEPCLSLFLTGASYTASGIDSEDSNWSGRWPNTGFVREQWSRLCARHHVPAQYHSSEMFVFLCNTPHLELVQLAQRCKPEICDIFGASSRDGIWPEVFISSQPTISIVFENPSALRQARDSGRLARDRDTILAVLRDRDQYDCFDPDRINIKFLDAKTSASALYGLSRED